MGPIPPEGHMGLLREGGAGRIGVAKQALQSGGGPLETSYYSNCEQDFYIIVNLPDNASSTAITLAGNASETFGIRSIPLLTPEEMDKAAKMRVDFRPPGH
jgi:uncharacterized protein with GYD domain